MINKYGNTFKHFKTQNCANFPPMLPLKLMNYHMNPNTCFKIPFNQIFIFRCVDKPFAFNTRFKVIFVVLETRFVA